MIRIPFRKRIKNPQSTSFSGIHEQQAETDGSYRIICPYCFKGYSHNEVVFRATNSYSNGMEPEEDIILQQHWEMVNNVQMAPEIKNKVLHPFDANECSEIIKDEKNITIAQIRDRYGKLTKDKICPHCHNPLPVTAGRIPNYIISLIGNTNAGKTVYLVRLVRIMKTILAKNFNIACTSISENAKLLDKKYEELFINGEMNSATEKIFQEPLIYSLRCGEKEINLTFYDFPGEAITNEDSFIEFKANNLMNSHALMLMLDILSIESICEILKGTGMNQQYFPEEKAEKYPKVFETLHEISVGSRGRMNIPVSAVFTKCDMLMGHMEALGMPEDTQIEKNSNYLNGIDGMDFYQVNNDIISLLKKHEDEIVSMCDNYFNLHYYFAVSAIGKKIGGNQLKDHSYAFRVLDPVLWILLQIGFIEIKGDPEVADMLKLGPRKG